MKALVTGATGFLGQHLTHRLCQLGFSVTALGRNLHMGKHLEENGAQFIYSNLEDRSQIHKLIFQQEYVFHCAALSSPWGQYADFFRVNVLGTKNIVDACLEAKIKRLVHVSSPSIYINLLDQFDVCETASLRSSPQFSYPRTKLMAEEEIARGFRMGLETVTIRPQAIFGPNDNAIFPRLARMAKKGFYPVIGHGDVTTDLTFVDNVVDALLLCLDAPKQALGENFNITNGEPVKLGKILPKLFFRLGYSVKPFHVSFKKAYYIAQALELVCGILPYRPEPLLTRMSVLMLGKSRTLSIARARNILGYVPQISFIEGLERVIKNWRYSDSCKA
jgi:nucleoside-diphosphate-sugar epimerase